MQHKAVEVTGTSATKEQQIFDMKRKKMTQQHDTVCHTQSSTYQDQSLLDIWTSGVSAAAERDREVRNVRSKVPIDQGCTWIVVAVVPAALVLLDAHSCS